MCADSLIKINLSSIHDMSDEKTKSFIDSKHTQNTFNRFAEFYANGKFTDFVLSGCDHRKFHIHSIVLAAASEYFYNIFLSMETKYHLDFVESDILEEIIQFCYTGQVDLSPENIQAIIFASAELGMNELKLLCNEFLESTSCGENYLQYALIADRYGLKSALELADKFTSYSCAKMFEIKELGHFNYRQLNDAVTNLCTSQFDLFDYLMQSLNFNGGESLTLSSNSYRAIYRTFFIAGYIESLRKASEQTLNYTHQNTVDIVELPAIIDGERIDEGLYLVAKSKCEGVEIYELPEIHGSLRIMPKYHINTDKFSIDTLKLFPNRDKIYFSCIKDQKLVIKSWSFKRQSMVDIFQPTTLRHLKPRLTNAVGDAFFVAEEKYVSWPYEGPKTTACRFGLESESYKSIELNCGGIKEIIGNGDEIFIFNQKADVFSFDLNGGKRTTRGTLNCNGIIKAIIFHGTVYVGCYIRSKCTLFVEQFNSKNNQWTTVGSICTYKDASNYHIGATDNYLYVFCGKGKVQRYDDMADQWTALDLPDNFHQTVLCISTNPFTGHLK